MRSHAPIEAGMVYLVGSVTASWIDILNYYYFTLSVSIRLTDKTDGASQEIDLQGAVRAL